MPYNIDPELAAALTNFPTFGAGGSLAETRVKLNAMSAHRCSSVDTSRVTVEDRMIPGPEHAPDVKVRVYIPKQREKTVAALLVFHGGGFAVGNLDSEHHTSVLMAERLGIVVVAVDYRLAPEHPYPAALDDCYAALQWLHAEAGVLAVDTTRIGVWGQSAGATLAAALTLLTRDRYGPPLCFQFLGIPALDDRMDTVSIRAFTDTPLINRNSSVISWNRYLSERFRPGSADVPAYAAPARALDLRNLPPAYIAVMEFDPLRDEGILYALALLAAGVAVELHTFAGAFHGSSMIEHAAITQRQEREMLEVLQRALAAKAI